MALGCVHRRILTASDMLTYASVRRPELADSGDVCPVRARRAVRANPNQDRRRGAVRDFAKLAVRHQWIAERECARHEWSCDTICSLLSAQTGL